MSRDFPDWVNPEKAAASRREFTGTLPLSRMTRLAELIEDPGDAEVAFELSFASDEQHQVRVLVSVSGEVPMRCQRTLGIYRQPIASQSVVGVVASEREADALPENYEPKLCTDQQLLLLELIEEEILLGLPLVPVDPESERIGDDSPPSDTQRPFAALADLKKKRDPNSSKE